MPPAEEAVSFVSPRDPKTAAELARPVLFLHIPKTAGTSFLLMLQNTFVDSNVRRIHTVDRRSQSIIDDIVEFELDRISCLTGHLPLHLFEQHLDRFQPFTILREPVSRVLSLFRFLKAGDPAELRRLNLRPDFALEELLDSRHPEIYGQINNGMVRLLCGDARMVDSGYREFWDDVALAKALKHALSNLQRIDFGLTEEMEPTLSLAQAKWSVPYALRQYRENAINANAANETIADLRRIVLANTLDLALYHWARLEFPKRARSLPQSGAFSRWNARSVFQPRMNISSSVREIAGRQGFHEFEPIGLAWLHADQTAEIHFVADADRVCLRLHLFCVIPAYPVADIIVSANDVCINHRFLPVDEKWGWLELDYFDTKSGLNKLAFDVPLYVPAIDVDPGSGDLRRLAIALANVVVHA